MPELEDQTKAALSRLRDRFRRERYKVNKSQKWRMDQGYHPSEELRREILTWLAAERELDRIEQDVKQGRV